MQAEQFKIVEKKSCLSHKKLKHYATGHISDREKNQIENHLLNCEKCIGALQGALEEKDTVEANRIFDQLFEEPFKIKKGIKDQDRIYPGFLRTKRTIGFIVLAITVCTGVFLFFHFFSLDFSTLSDTHDSPKSYLPLTIQKEAIVTKTPEAHKTIVEIADRPEPIPVPHSERDRSAEQKAILSTPIVEPVEKSKPLPATVNKTVANTNPVSEIKEPPLAAIAKAKPFERFHNKPTVIAEPAYINNYKISLRIAGLTDNSDKEHYKNRLEEVLSLVDKAQYKEALSGIQKLFFNLPTDINAKYYRGYIYYLMENNEKALTDFESILDNMNKTFYEDARWYKILLLNRSSRFEESKKMLNEVIAENGPYRRKAQQLLSLIAGN